MSFLARLKTHRDWCRCRAWPAKPFWMDWPNFAARPSKRSTSSRVGSGPTAACGDWDCSKYMELVKLDSFLSSTNWFLRIGKMLTSAPSQSLLALSPSRLIEYEFGVSWFHASSHTYPIRRRRPKGAVDSSCLGSLFKYWLGWSAPYQSLLLAWSQLRVLYLMLSTFYLPNSSKQSKSW